MNATIEETLLDLFQQVIEDPDRIPAVPIEDWPEDAGQRRLLTGFRGMLERLQQRQQDRLDTQGRFWLAVQGANDGLWDRHIPSDEYHLSTRWKSMLGYEEHEIADTVDEWRNRIHPEDLDRTLAAGRAYINGETNSYEIEYRLRHKDGSYRWILARGAALRDANGKAYRLAGSNTDITERKLAEQQLHEREEQYRSIFEATDDGLFITDFEDGHLVEVNPAAYKMHGYSYQEFLALHPTAFIHPDSHHLFTEYLQTVKAGGQFHAQALDVHKDGTTFPVEVHGTSFIYKGKPHVLGIVHDITERVQAQQLLEQRVEERTRELSTLLEVSHNVASTIELKPLLDLILDQLKVVVDYAGSAITILEDEDLVLVGTRGPESEEHLVQRRFPLKHFGLIWETLCRGEPVIVDNVRNATPLAQAYREAVGELLETPFRYIRSWVAVPLKLKDRVIGMLSASHSQPDYYTFHHADLAMAIANQAAIAIENARLYAQAQDLAALEERQKLARELHDSVSQALYGISLGTHAARMALSRDPDHVADSLDYVLSLAEAGLAEMRALIFELRPESLETEGLVSALTKQAAALQARHEIAVSTQLCDEPDLPLRTKQELYRIAQEAMHNTVKHARANKVDLVLRRTANAVILSVRDDGVGFDPLGSFPGHLGLRSMQERVSSLGGSLQIESAPRQGTHLLIQVPSGKPDSR